MSEDLANICFMSDILRTIFDAETRIRLDASRKQLEARFYRLEKAIAELEEVERKQRRTKLFPDEWKLYYDRAELKDALFAIYLRQNVPFASGPPPLDPDQRWTMWRDRMIRAEWECYFQAAQQVGMFDGAQGANLVKALRSARFEQFHSAMAECMVCWLLAGSQRYKLEPYVKTVGEKDVEFRARKGRGEFYVEVKAPYRPSPSGLFRSVGPSERIDGAVARAGQKFLPGKVNVVVVVPTVDGIWREEDARRAYFQAVYGQSGLTWKIDTRTGFPSGVSTIFKRDGRFLKPRKQGLPAHTRISGFLGVRRITRGDPELGTSWIDHELLLLENPNAEVRLPKSFFPHVPRLISRRGRLKWSDNYPIDA